jgi:hypothetical protein
MNLRLRVIEMTHEKAGCALLLIVLRLSLEFGTPD